MRSKIMCGAKTRKGTSCQCKAMANGRCKFHGGMSTGPKTVEGKKRALANLKQHRNERMMPTSQVRTGAGALSGTVKNVGMP